MVASIFNATCFSPTSALIPLVGLLPEVTLSANSLNIFPSRERIPGTLLAVIPAIFSITWSSNVNCSSIVLLFVVVVILIPPRISWQTYLTFLSQVYLMNSPLHQEYSQFRPR